MTNINTICFDPTCYECEYYMWNDMSMLIKTLTTLNYIIAVRPEDFGLIYVEFEPQNRELGDPYLHWLTPSESERLIYDNEMEDAEENVQD